VPEQRPAACSADVALERFPSIVKSTVAALRPGSSRKTYTSPDSTAPHATVCLGTCRQLSADES
jgi:hypothetical protein